jgi:hypothetical protein
MSFSMSRVAPLREHKKESKLKGAGGGRGKEEAYSGNVIRGPFVNACTKTGRDLSGSITGGVLY